MKLYSISDEYINHLRKKFPRVYSNKENRRVHTRKYLGAVVEIETHKYYIPLSSPKDKHDYIMVDGKKTIRKNEKRIMKNAKVLYSKRKSGDENKVVQSCLDFVALEKECDNWKNKED